MNKPVHILHLEDDPDYSDLVRSLLEQAGIPFQLELVSNRADFETAVARHCYDLILADYSLPSYTGLEALRHANQFSPEIPFVLISGTIGEHAAIQSLQRGATDYVLKQWPERLIPTIRRAANIAEERSQRHKVETELVRRERYFRTLMENSLDLLSILNREGHYCYNSPSVKLVLGYESRELAGTSAFALIHPEDLPETMRVFQAGLAAPGLKMRLEFRVRHQDGSWRFLEAVGLNQLADPEIAGVVINSRDVTARKEAETRLRSSEMLFHSVWENSGDGMRLTDEAGRIVAVNQAFCRLVGRTREELENQLFTVMFGNDESVDEELVRYKQRFSQRIIEPRVERRITLRDGLVVSYEDTNSFVELAGRPPMLLSLFRDVTVTKRLEEQLRQSQKMEAIGQLAGGVAHDFNNILTVIQGHAALLVHGGSLSSASEKSANQIVQAAQRASALTRQLLTFSRRQVMQPRCLDMNELVSNMTRMLVRILGEDILLQLNYLSAPAFVEADPTMMEQVLLNLAVNARDAMVRGGQLTITISTAELDAHQLASHTEFGAGPFVCLTVTDNGCGIPAENLRRIFEPFFTTKEVGKGTGLGLATVYGIVKQHRGWVEVDSVPDAGASFRVYLPASQGELESPEDSPPAQAVRGGHETILVVEDEEPVRELVCDFLAGHGYRILRAESGLDALQVWKEANRHIDLVLTDLVMPDRINGRELAERLWAERPDLKVIFMSGYSAEVVGRDFVLQRGLNYLQKPYQPEKLALVVRECLDSLN